MSRQSCTSGEEVLVSTLIRTVRPLERRALTRLPTASLRSTIVCVAPSFCQSAGIAFSQRTSFAHNDDGLPSHEAEVGTYPDGLHRGEQEAVFVIVQRRLVGGS